MDMKKLILVSLFFVMCMFYVQPSFASANADNTTSAKSMVVIETSENKIIYSKNENEKLPMASTTKIVTALTILEHAPDLDKLVTIPRSATLAEGSSIYLRAGEQLSIRDLLYGLMLQSGNDAAESLALEIAGSLDSFAVLMNETAKKCGAENSSFVTPHGLDDPNHFTTALDLAKITSYALKNPEFKKIVSTKTHIIKATEHNTARTLINKNKLLSSLEGCIGVKTGYTKKSGRCLVSACEKDGAQFVCVVLNCGPMFEDSARLLCNAMKEYKRHVILPDYKYITDISVEHGKSASIRCYIKDGFSVVDKDENLDKYVVKYEYENVVKAPVFKGDKLGSVKVFYDNDLIFSENLCSIENVEVEDVSELKSILDKW